MKQILVIGSDEINKHLAEGWRAVMLACAGAGSQSSSAFRVVAILEWPENQK